MEVDIHSFRRELSTVEVQRQKQVLAMEIQRQEFQLQLMGKPPRFVWQLNSLKVSGKAQIIMFLLALLSEIDSELILLNASAASGVNSSSVARHSICYS